MYKLNWTGLFGFKNKKKFKTLGELHSYRNKIGLNGWWKFKIEDMNEIAVCKHWKELDGINGVEYEYCRLEMKKCYCCGTKSQCSFKWALDKEKV